jgi:hypothetical protein
MLRIEIPCDGRASTFTICQAGKARRQRATDRRALPAWQMVMVLALPSLSLPLSGCQGGKAWKSTDDLGGGPTASGDARRRRRDGLYEYGYG